MSLHAYIDKKVCVITTDGRTIIGTLVSCDQLTNLALSGAIERIIRPQDDPEPSSVAEQDGIQLIRGDCVVLCGLVDEELDQSIDWTIVRGEVIGGTKHV